MCSFSKPRSSSQAEKIDLNDILYDEEFEEEFYRDIIKLNNRERHLSSIHKGTSDGRK